MDKQRFISLWSESSIEGINSDAIFTLLEQHYSEPYRYYHNAEHIEHCLIQFDTIVAKLTDPVAVELALWFHDVIYDPRSNSNEQKSADLFRSLVGEQKEVEFVNKVLDLIIVTVHRLPPKNSDQEYMLDIDLSAFALPWNIFKRNSKNIRREYNHLSNEEFNGNQLSFLHELLKRPQFFYSNFFQQNYENMARENIVKYLQKINHSIS